MFPPFKKVDVKRGSRNSNRSQRIKNTADYGIINSDITEDYGSLDLEKIKIDLASDSINFKLVENPKLKMTNTEEVSNEFKSVFNQLRMPDAIKDLPCFDGNKRTLFDFIGNVEDILQIITQIDGTAYSKIIIRGIRNKIVGQANEVLNMYGTSLVWEDIKNNLILHYSDKRNETSLIRDLHQISQGNDHIEKFYANLIEIYSTITNHIKIHEIDINVIKSKLTLYSEMCLNSFLSGMKEPLGSIIRAMRPTSLSEAFNFCLQEQNISYIRNNYNYKSSTQVHNRKIIPFKPNFQYTQSTPIPMNYRFPNNNNYLPPNTNNNFKPYFNQNLKPNFNTRPLYSQPTHNSNNQNKYPQPMDTTSTSFANRYPTRFSPNNNNSSNNFHRHPHLSNNNNFNRQHHLPNTNNFNRQPHPPNNNFFKTNGPPRIFSEELFTIENPNQTNEEHLSQELFTIENSNQINEENYNQHQNYFPGLNQSLTNEIDDENFQLSASQMPLDT